MLVSRMAELGVLCKPGGFHQCKHNNYDFVHYSVLHIITECKLLCRLTTIGWLTGGSASSPTRPCMDMSSGKERNGTTTMSG